MNGGWSVYTTILLIHNPYTNNNLKHRQIALSSLESYASLAFRIPELTQSSSDDAAVRFAKLEENINALRPIHVVAPTETERARKNFDYIDKQNALASASTLSSFSSSTSSPSPQPHGEPVYLESVSEREFFFAVFAFLASAYVHLRNQSDLITSADVTTPIILHPNIAMPLARLAKAVGRHPIIDYATCVLCNWYYGKEGENESIPNKLDSPSFSRPPKLTFDNIQVRFTLTGHPAEKWFYITHAVIESHGTLALEAMHLTQDIMSKQMMFFALEKAPQSLMSKHDATQRKVALQNILRHMKRFSVSSSSLIETGGGMSRNSSIVSLHTSNPAETVDALRIQLKNIAESLSEMNQSISRLSERCPPDIFYEIIRPWLGGWPDSRGVIYSGVDTEVKKFSGASGAESSLVPAIDSFFGISYGSSGVSIPAQRRDGDAPANSAGSHIEGRSGLGKFVAQLLRYRGYMPPPHRKMIANFESGFDIRDCILTFDEKVQLLIEQTNEASSSEEQDSDNDDPDSLLSLKATTSRLKKSLNLLKKEYNRCIENLLAFRLKHVGLAQTYIVKMGRERGEEKKIGTGGSEFSVHLARHVQDTRACLYEVDKSED